MGAAAVPRHGDDPVFCQAEIGDPAANVFSGRPALPPAWKPRIGVETEGVEQRAEKLFKSIIARSRALLLLYWFPLWFSYRVSLRISEMETGQIRRWLWRFFGDGSISGIRTWIVAVIAIVGLGSAVVFFVRRIWKPIFEAEDVARRLASMRLRIVTANPVDQPRFFQRPEMVVQG